LLSYRLPVPPSCPVTLFVVIGAVPSIVTLVALSIVGQRGQIPVAVLVGFVAFAAVVALAFWGFGAGRVWIDRSGLRASAASYRIAVGSQEIVTAGARRLSSLQEVQLHRRTNGIGLPGYRVGWYSVSVQGTRHAAFLLVTGTPILLVPLTDGKLILLSCPAEQAHAAVALLSSTERSATA